MIISHRCGKNINQKLSFPSLIFGLLESQKPLQEPNEYLSALLQPYVLRFKEKAIESYCDWGATRLCCCRRELLCCNRRTTSCKLLLFCYCPLLLLSSHSLRLSWGQLRKSRCSRTKSLIRPLLSCNKLRSYCTVHWWFSSIAPPGSSIATELPTAKSEPPVAIAPQPVTFTSKKGKKKWFYLIFIYFLLFLV